MPTILENVLNQAPFETQYLSNDNTETTPKSRFLVFLHQRYHLSLKDPKNRDIQNYSLKTIIMLTKF